jgi:hypothetical protein
MDMVVPLKKLLLNFHPKQASEWIGDIEKTWPYRIEKDPPQFILSTPSN